MTLRVLQAVIMFASLSCSRSGSPPAMQDERGPSISGEYVGVESSLDCPSGTRLSYENFGAPFMARYCTACHHHDLKGDARHGAPSSLDFDTMREVVLARLEIRSAVVDRAAMPPSQRVPDIERTLLREWIDCGSPE